MENFEKLSDAEVFEEGTTKVWYAKSLYMSDSLMGYRYLKKYDKLPSKERIEDYYIELGTIKASNTNGIFLLLQGDVWSPNGEARELIEKKGLTHTSLSVGDIIQIDDKFHMVDCHGFEEI